MAELVIGLRLQRHEHVAARTIKATPDYIRSLIGRPAEEVNKFLTGFFSSERLLRGISPQVNYDLLSHIARIASASPAIPLDQVISQADSGLADFARDNGLAFFTFELAKGETPKPARHLHIVRETGAEVGVSEAKKTVFISKNDTEILKMKATLDEESQYMLEGMVQGQHLKIDVTEEAQKFLVDLVFPIEDRHLDLVFKTRLPGMIILVLQRYLKGSELPRAKHGASLSQLELELGRCSLKFSMILDVLLDYFRCYLVPHCPHKIAVFPQFPTPKFLFQPFEFLEHLACRDALEYPHHLRNRIPGWKTYQKMHMLLPDLHRFDLNPKVSANLFEYLFKPSFCPSPF